MPRDVMKMNDVPLDSISLCIIIMDTVGVMCYECNHLRPKEEIQDRPCTVCGGSKCKALHGGAEMWNCDKCGKRDLCADCSTFERCCDTDDPYTERLRTWHSKGIPVRIVGDDDNILPPDQWQKP